MLLTVIKSDPATKLVYGHDTIKIQQTNETGRMKSQGNKTRPLEKNKELGKRKT
jgi:hypothetical protein